MRETSIGCLSQVPQPGTRPATQACALTMNQLAISSQSGPAYIPYLAVYNVQPCFMCIIHGIILPCGIQLLYPCIMQILIFPSKFWAKMCTLYMAKYGTSLNTLPVTLQSWKSPRREDRGSKARLPLAFPGFLHDREALSHCFMPLVSLISMLLPIVPPQILRPEECMYAVGQVCLTKEAMY